MFDDLYSAWKKIYPKVATHGNQQQQPDFASLFPSTTMLYLPNIIVVLLGCIKEKSYSHQLHNSFAVTNSSFSYIMNLHDELDFSSAGLCLSYYFLDLNFKGTVKSSDMSMNFFFNTESTIDILTKRKKFLQCMLLLRLL